MGEAGALCANPLYGALAQQAYAGSLNQALQNGLGNQLSNMIQQYAQNMIPHTSIGPSSPSHPNIGDTWFDVRNQNMHIWNGSAWQVSPNTLAGTAHVWPEPHSIVLARAENLPILKFDRAMDKLIGELPMKIAGRIKEVRLQNESGAYAFVVTCDIGQGKGRDIIFENVDTFPDDADIARIALECT